MRQVPGQDRVSSNSRSPSRPRLTRISPSLCAEPVTSPAGQAALVADTYKRWMVGAAPQEAQDAAVLFTDAQTPGDPRVQAILKHLARSRPAA